MFFYRITEDGKYAFLEHIDLENLDKNDGYEESKEPIDTKIN